MENKTISQVRIEYPDGTYEDVEIVISIQQVEGLEEKINDIVEWGEFSS